MKRPLAYPDHRMGRAGSLIWSWRPTTALLAYEAGFFSICPLLYLPLFFE